MEKLWSEFMKKGDIYSYLKYKKVNSDKFDLEVSDINGSGKGDRNSIKNI